MILDTETITVGPRHRTYTIVEYSDGTWGSYFDLQRFRSRADLIDHLVRTQEQGENDG